MMASNSSSDGVLMFAKQVSTAVGPQPSRQAAAPIALGSPVFLSASQREAANDIRRALAERHVFAAVTGAPGLGKTAVLSTVTAAQSGPPLRVVRIDHPDRVSVEQALQTEQLIAQPAADAPNGCHTVLVVDDADRASAALLRCLTRVAENGRLSRDPPQVILAGRPELWDRLSAEEFTPLRERIAIRPVLRPMTEEDARGLITHLLNEPRKIFGQTLADDAEREVLRLADGRPERIGALVRSTLMLGDLQTRPQLSVEMVRTTADMLDGQPRQNGKRRAGVLLPVFAAALAVAMTGGLVVAGRGRLDPYLFAARDIAGHAAAWWTRLASDAAEMLAAAPQRASAGPLPTDSPRGPAAEARQFGPTQDTPPATLPAPSPAAEDAAEARAAESQPQTETEALGSAPTAASQLDSNLPSPATPEPASPETPDAPAVAASGPAASEGQMSQAAQSQGTYEASEPTPAAEPPQDAPGVTAEQPPAAPIVEPALTVEPAPAVEAAAPAPAPEVPVALPSTEPNAPTMPERSLAVLAPGMVAMLLRRGDEALALRDVSAARRLYERTIPTGSALGARGVARTYDPAVLGRGNPMADSSAAAAWYDRAARLEARSDGHEASAGPPVKAER